VGKAYDPKIDIEELAAYSVGLILNMDEVSTKQ
jgi:hypothetical protein